jgi:hypothetical protein
VTRARTRRGTGSGSLTSLAVSAACGMVIGLGCNEWRLRVVAEGGEGCSAGLQDGEMC